MSNLQGRRQAAKQRQEQRQRRWKLFGVIASIAAIAIAAIAVATLLNRDDGTSSGDAANLRGTMETAAFAGGPRLAVDQTRIDHGDVSYGHEVEATYRLKNVGDQPLRIQNPEVTILEGC